MAERIHRTAREKMLTFISRNGWVLDPAYCGREPFTFVRAAASGGQWRIALDYTKKTGYSETGTLLQSVTIWRVPVDAKLEEKFYFVAGDRKKLLVPKGERIGSLTRRGAYDGYTALYDVTGFEAYDSDADDENISLRKRAERLVKDVELTVWLAAELAWEKGAEQRARDAAAKKEREMRERPLPVTAKQKTTYSEDMQDPTTWNSLAKRLYKAAGAISSADGLSDLYELMAEVHTAVDAIDKVIV